MNFHTIHISCNCFLHSSVCSATDVGLGERKSDSIRNLVINNTEIRSKRDGFVLNRGTYVAESYKNIEMKLYA